MRRRHFIHLLGGAVAWPMAVHAQLSARRPLVAVLSGVTREGYARVSAFERGMRELGYVDGQNIDIEYRFADGRLEYSPDLPRNWSDFRQMPSWPPLLRPLSR
jgi:putative ABC transport system substrate-binding protein